MSRPVRLLLPSGLRVQLQATPRGGPEDDDTVEGRPLFTGRLFRALEEGALAVRREGEPTDLALADFEDWPLVDWHALRDAAERLSVIAPVEEEDDPRCRNCDRPLAVDPTLAGTADLRDWYEDEQPFPEETLSLGCVVSLAGGRKARDFRVRPVTVRQARPLWRAVVRDAPFDVTPRLVAALGVVALGEERRPPVIARALERAPDAAWASLETAFAVANYAARSTFPFVCPDCGALHDVLAPGVRETEIDPEAERRMWPGGLDRDGEAGDVPEDFPGEEAFAALAERLRAEVYAARRVDHVAFFVETGVPDVDGSGEPLLGSYLPRYEGDGAGYTSVDFLITLYYRTFQRMWEEDGPYDVAAEIRETIDHEVEHHLYHLAGHDPMDEEERAEALRELERTFGKRRVREAQVAEVVGELSSFARFFVPFLLLCAALVGILYALGILRD